MSRRHRNQGAGLSQRAMSSAGIGLGGTAGLRLAGLLALALAGLFALTAGSASAATVRPFESQITEADGTVFADPTGLAVDNADDLWVSDPGLSPIDKFDSLGATA